MTPEAIHSRCIEEGDCWLWQGLVSHSGVPKVGVGNGRGGRSVLSARRVAWETIKGPIPPKKLVTTSCGNPTCMNPDHLILTTRAKVAAKVGARPDVKAKRLASMLGEKSHRAVLTRTQVEEMRASGMTAAQLAKTGKYPCVETTIAKVLTGQTWRDYSNPFAGLMV